MEKSPFVTCDNLVKIYKVADLEVVALQGLDLEVQAGEIMAPAPVERPIPPRKASHTGQLWPATAAMPATVTAHGSVHRVEASSVTHRPLNISTSMTTTRAILPAPRETFKAPVCLLPCIRGSGQPNRYDSSTPDGMLPIR